MENSVAATSGSSGWLKSKMLESTELDAMVNYEAMVSEANIGWTTVKGGKKIVHQGLIKRGWEPLHVVYIKDATMLADHPLGFVNRGSEAKAQIFKELQTFLLGTEAQKEMIRLGRRTKLLGMDSSLADKNAFDPKHGFDVDRIISPINPPHEEVLTAILDLYQEQVRKPSATYWVIDDSGSMYKNGGKKAVQEAMHILLDPAQARRFKLQPTAKDIHAVLPFSNAAGKPLRAEGNDPGELTELMNQIREIQMGGGTNMFAGVIAALNLIKQEEAKLAGHFPAIAVLSDGQSDGSLTDVLSTRQRLGLNYVPIHTLSFGSAVDEKQLYELAAAGGGRYFSGKKDVAHAFRQMKGYN
jgi:Ca-activated chloride channel family protein